MLRTLDWIEDYGAHEGGQIWMSAVGLADVIAIDPCPEIQPGPGRLVTGTFQHTAGIVLDLKVESETKPIGVTPTHPSWSVSREDWVAAGELLIGEKLETLNGTTVVESIVRRPELETVYNIEVEGDHVYRVGESGILVHNASAPPADQDFGCEKKSGQGRPNPCTSRSALASHQIWLQHNDPNKGSTWTCPTYP